MKHVNELRDQVSIVFAELKAGSIEPKVAKELANLAGKMVNSAKVQLDYHAMRKETTAKIFFLHSVDK
jgi:hypothetical protein